MKLDVALYDKAGIGPSDLHRLLGVSRTTTSKWYSGAGVHFHLRDKLTQVNAAVRAALAKKELPVACASRIVDVRAAAIAEVVRRHIKG